MSADPEAPEKRRSYPQAEAARSPASTPEWAARRRLAAAMRRVIEELVLTDAPTDEIERAAGTLEAFADSLTTHPKRNGLEGYAESANSGDVHAFFDQSPLIGLSNPLAPPITLEVKDGAVKGSVVFGSAYEGPPRHVHGGFVAAAFDEILGFAQSLTGAPGMTARLTVRYRRPTPLLAPLELEARVDRVEGRKIFASARMYCRGELTADAEGLFISMNPTKFRELVAAETARRGSSQD
ncbi:MAG: PaaI family thioesterase [Candidatus Binatia bacterium]